jgi:predicted MFS family arabinose efflux permease
VDEAHGLIKADVAAAGPICMILFVFALCSFAATAASRAVDPMISLIAADFAVPVATAALLSSAYALPFALFQPILGPIGDIWGKSRLLRTALWMLAITLIAGAFAPTLVMLMALRFIGGIGGGGTIPSGMALIGDRYTGPARQVALARFVGAGLAGQIVGGSAAGFLAEAFGWRVSLLAIGGIAIAAAVAASAMLREAPDRVERSFSLAEAIGGYRLVFANPRAYVCFGTVMAEGIALFGAAPFIADLMERAGTGGAKEAGLAIGAIGAGGLVYTLIVPVMMRWLGRTTTMALGGLLGASGPLALALGLTAFGVVAAFIVSGLGYMMLHSSIQKESVELAPTARSSAYSMHAFFFFSGHSLGPILVGLAMAKVGPTATLAACGALFAATGIAAALLLARLDARIR